MQKYCRFIIVGFLFVCLDINMGFKFDVFSDGVGFLLIAVGTMSQTKQNKFFIVPTILASCLAIVSWIVKGWMYLGTASWALIFARCFVPTLSIPLGIILVKIIVSKNGSVNKNEKIKEGIFFYSLAQIADVLCIAYFAPVNNSMVLNNMNTSIFSIIVATGIYGYFFLRYLKCLT